MNFGDIPRLPGIQEGECGTFPMRGLPRASHHGTCIPNPVAVGNDAISGSTPCPDGLCGGPIDWSVAANVHFAPTKAEANTLAQDTAIFHAINDCVSC